MSVFGTRGAADDLARALDSGAGSGTPELALAARLRSTGAALDAGIVPRAEFKDALRMRLMAVATVQAAAPAPVAAPAAPVRALQAAVSWRSRAGAVAAGAMASVVAVSGVAVAGSQSLPGDPFYGVKRTTEAFQLRTADGDVERGTRHLDFAATRLREVRGLTLGRDAVDAGPKLGPAAIGGGITLRSASQPLADGAALSPEVAERVRGTLSDMDAATRKGTTLLTSAYRSSQAAEPLRALSRFTTRQSAGLEQLLPALPPATQTRARISLALLTDVGERADELLGIGTCGLGCDPSQAAPSLPGASSASSASSGSAGPAGCECPAPAPAPQPSAVPPSSEEPATSETSSPEPTRTTSPSPQPSATPSPTPSPTPSSTLPVPVPTAPVPVPTLPLPLPSPTLTAPAVLEPVASVLPGINGSSQQAPAEPVSTPLPQLAPVPPRP